MKTFTDNAGQKWVLSLNLGKVRKMRDSLGLDLLNPQHYLQVLGSQTDRLTFAFLMVEAEAKKLGIDADQFEERLYGEDFATNAGLAFLEETECFFTKLGQQAMASLANRSIETMQKNLQKQLELMESGKFNEALDEMEDELESLVTEAFGTVSPS